MLRAPRRIRSLSAAYSVVLANRREIGWIGTRSQIPVTAEIITPLHAVSAPLSLLLYFVFVSFYHFLVVKLFLQLLPPSAPTPEWPPPLEMRPWSPLLVFVVPPR